MKYTYITLFTIALSFSACQNSDNKSSEESKNKEQQEETVDNTTSNQTQDAVINVNIATEKQINDLNISSSLKTSILEQRPFISMNELDALVDLDTDKEALYKMIFVPFNINTTLEDDFKMIPGVGDKMAHEFEEYRPYRSIKQFRKEIGKYVDDEQIAIYEQYVFVPVELNTSSEEDIKVLPGVGELIAHEIEEYRPYQNMAQFRKELGKYVDDKELKRLERLVYIK